MSPTSRPPTVITLSRDEMRSRALAFAKRWAGPQREEAEAKTFLDEFFSVFGRDRHAVDARFEHRVEREARGEGRIDLFWPGKLVVEMKSTGRDLAEAYTQALDYVKDLDPEERPRWLLASDFARFALYDLGEEIHEDLKGFAAGKREPALAAAFTLDQLADKLRHFAFIRDEEQALFQTQPEVNLKAVALLARLHDALKATGFGGHELERFLVRVLFCLFAEDTDIFPWNSFTRVVETSRKDGSDLGCELARLFQALNESPEVRTPRLPAKFAAFPYVNGGLFAERLGFIDFTANERAALLACCRFDWSRISPSIFGSLFQGVMEPVERRKLGAHYTSEENIRRVIDPLFLDALKAEFAKLRATAGKKKALEQFHQRLSTLRFLDPACGCGNFLVVAYRELRSLELAVLHEIYGGQLALDLDIGDIVRVNVDQFYGIEIEEFPALIAETALWLTDHQVNVAVSKAFGRHYARIPLVKSPTIVIGNALQLDWHSVLAATKCNFLFGNPPFIGRKYQSVAQRADMDLVAGAAHNHGLLDYVCGWYFKAARYIAGTTIRCAFVSTNSITQGEQVGVLWGHLLQHYKIKIHFGHRTFAWQNEASGKAHVHVVIIGFGAQDSATKQLFDYDSTGKPSVSSGTANLSPYLMVGSDTVITNRSTPLCAVPELGIGNKPIDGGYYLFTPTEKSEFVRKEPSARAYFKRWIGAEEFLNGTERWCLWLGECPPQELRKMPEAQRCVELVAKYRRGEIPAKGKEDKDRDERRNEGTVKLATTPTRFHVEFIPKTNYLVIPEVSSENRRYIPIGFLGPDVLCSNKVRLMPEATPFHFGVLSSAMHMAWVAVVTGRLKSDFQYSIKLVYNNYPWPDPTYEQRSAIETAAQAVLDARAPHLARGASLADLYDPLAMPAGLLKAHQTLDRAVDKSYRAAAFTSDRERVEFLFARYEKISAPLAPAAPKPKRAKKSAPAKSAEYPTQADLDSAHVYFGAKEDPPKE
ncbi:MAG TPA: DNA methyltransferase [Opitutaceae bacterium]|nr:DNA methyltransferase [Opitutaceae bacterium]